ncbi:MAG: hypothetical protein IPP34_21090 [Bacteroidetes bacterium]|nr:hypothetical protein [Bacteroidota bacterium]
MKSATRYIFTILTIILMATSLHGQDIPFSDKFFPSRISELKLALIDLQQGDEFL